MSGNRAIIRVSTELIKQSLAFPDNAKIVDIQSDFMRPGVFLLLVESPDFSETKEGDAYPEITPTFTVDYARRPSTWISCDWDL